MYIARRDISKFTDQQEKEEERSHRSGHSTKGKFILAVDIRVLAGGSPHEMSLAFDIGFSTVYPYFHSLIDSKLNWINVDSILRTEKEL